MWVKVYLDDQIDHISRIVGKSNALVTGVAWETWLNKYEYRPVQLIHLPPSIKEKLD